MYLAKKKRSNKNKASYTLFYNNKICLLRVDTYGNNAPHINSDGTIIPAKTPHIHIFDEQSGDHDAMPLPSSFKNADDIIETLVNFLKYCNIDTNGVRIL